MGPVGPEHSMPIPNFSLVAILLHTSASTNDLRAHVYPVACSRLLFNCEICVNLYTYHIPGIPEEMF